MPSRDTKVNNSNPNQPRRAPTPMLPGSWILAVVLIGLVLLILMPFVNPSAIPISYSQFKEQIQLKNLTKVKFVSNQIKGEFIDLEKLPLTLREKKIKHFTTQRPSQNSGVEDRELIPQLQEAKIDFEFEADAWPWLGPLIYTLLPLVLLVILIMIFMPRFRDPLSGGFLNSYVKSPAKKYESSKMRVTFNDVAGMENAKLELQEVVDFLSNPEKYQRLGGQIPKGVLLFGPPGTGKTLLARAVAGEAGVPFFSIGGSEFMQMFVGVGATRVRDLFKTARDNAPCIIFIDEIDAVGRRRGASMNGGHDGEREQTLNQILSEMDGFLPTDNVIVIAATNRPDVLDPALLRPGRFDRHIGVDRPTWQGRLAILKVHTRDKPLANDVKLDNIARSVIGMTGADLRNLANEAALIAARENQTKISRRHFEAAADRVMIGTKREELLTADDKRRTAYHEAGHALVTWYQPAADKPLKVSIIPRGQTLGVNLMVPEEDRVHHGKDQFMAYLVMAMGGRAADRLVYGNYYSGVEDDLKKATRVARMMVTRWGMSEHLGPVSYQSNNEGDYPFDMPMKEYSDETAKRIDQEVQTLLCNADQSANQILEAHRKELDMIVEALLQREELHKDEIEMLLKEGRLPPIEETAEDNSAAEQGPNEEAIGEATSQAAIASAT